MDRDVEHIHANADQDVHGYTYDDLYGDVVFTDTYADGYAYMDGNLVYIH